MSDHRFPGLGGGLEQVVAEGIYARHATLAVVDGERCVTVEAGRPWGGDSGSPRMWELFCLAKPLVAHAVFCAAKRRGIDPTEPLNRLADAFGHFDDRVSIAGAITHAAGLQQPPAVGWVCTEVAQRPTVAELTQRPLGDECYSEVAAGIVLAAVCTELLGTTLAAIVDAELVEPLGLDAELVLDPDRAAALQPEGLAYLRSGLPVDDLPLLHLAQPTYRARSGGEFGGFGTASALATALHRLLGAAMDSPDSGMLRHRRPTAHDVVWDRNVGFVGPFVADDVFEGDGLWSLTALSASFVYLDPQRRVVFAAFLDGADLGAAEAQVLRRELTSLLLADLAGAAG